MLKYFKGEFLAGGKYTVGLLFLLLTTFISCSTPTQPPPLENGTISLSVSETSCTAAWVNIKTQNVSFPSQVTISLNNKEQKQIDITTNDTTAYIDSLLPNKSYQIQARLNMSGKSVISNKYTLQTLDTTGNNFTWQTWTFGQIASNVLNDVAVIDENNIWAVGEIFMNDSTGQPDQKIYNAVHWNGSKWELKRIEFFTICGQTNKSIYAAKAIYALNENEIWIAMDGHEIAKVENGVQTEILCMPWSFVINKMWESNSGELYIVGNSGNIVQYKNGIWKKIESGTSSNIVDIWGIKNNEGSYNKYLSAVNEMLVLDKANNLSSINGQANIELRTICGNSNRQLITAGYGVALFRNFNWVKITDPLTTRVFSIGGNSNNDIYGLSANRDILHFNGYRWFSINNFQNNTYTHLDVKDKSIGAVGWQGDKAAITIIKAGN